MLSTGPVLSHAATTRPPQQPEYNMRRNNLPHRPIPPVEARQLRHGIRPLPALAGRQTFDRQAEVDQLVQRTGEDRGSLPAGGGIDGDHAGTIGDSLEQDKNVT
jgi:hypothetical protein